MKLWDKGYKTAAEVEAFTVGRDRDLDLLLAPWDIVGSMAHTRMLEKVGLLPKGLLRELYAELRELYYQAESGRLRIEAGVEDIHSQVELLLTKKLGDSGKMIHSGRSRNDQVLVDLRLFYRDAIRQLVQQLSALFDQLLELGRKHQNVLLPGYTHFQVAMPSSFGLWFGAYAESLADDLLPLQAAYRLADQNPLGSAAGYGSSFPLDRQYTTELLGFSQLNISAAYAQMARGKVERALAAALSSIGSTLNKLASDACLYLSQNFAFISFPDHLTTGSSIMPHKKNPDVFELIRARTNQVQALPNEVALLSTNLPGGYHRDFQLFKEAIFPAIERVGDCLKMTRIMLAGMEVKTVILSDPKYDYLFTVEKVNSLVLKGVPFRDAYKQVGEEIAAGTFTPDKTLNHSHLGSIGNPGFDEIRAKFEDHITPLDASNWEMALYNLVEWKP